MYEWVWAENRILPRPTHAIIFPVFPAKACEVLITEGQIRERVAQLGDQITRDYQERAPLLIGVLRGGAIFHADLMRQVRLNVRVDFISVSSYGTATESSGQVQLLKDVESSIQDVDVVLVEGIVDTGLTVNYLVRNLRSRQPASLRICALLSKPSRRKVEVPIDYIGFEIPDQFVVGYGLDYEQKYRNLASVSVLGDGKHP